MRQYDGDFIKPIEQKGSGFIKKESLKGKNRIKLNQKEQDTLFSQEPNPRSHDVVGIYAANSAVGGRAEYFCVWAE